MHVAMTPMRDSGADFHICSAVARLCEASAGSELRDLSGVWVPVRGERDAGIANETELSVGKRLGRWRNARAFQPVRRRPMCQGRFTSL